ncbi:MAG: hypothetical protein H6671_18215 [Anaerolineaceae bacterium]|nr:hypothetical protein [Anaerolineaceae bacterium]
MSIDNQLPQSRNGEEMVKRVLAIASLLSKGMNPHSTPTNLSQGAQPKTQDTKAGVSSER